VHPTTEPPPRSLDTLVFATDEELMIARSITRVLNLGSIRET
jgi:acetate kinase